MKRKVCKKCNLEKELSEFNKDKYALDGLRYRCRKCTKAENKNHYDNNQEKEILRTKNYQSKNKEAIKQKRKVYHKKRYDSDILYKLKYNVRNRIKHFLKSKNFNIKRNGTFNMVGCTPQELKEYLEKQFTNDMTWENHMNNGWHIEHRIPLDSAKTIESVYELCHYTNLQPMWSYDNYKKGTKIM